MPKILGTRSGKNRKVVEFFYRSPTKLSLHFSKFSTIFYGFYKNQQNTFEIYFCDQALDSFDSSRRYPRFTQNTPRRRRGTQLGPRAMGAAVPAKIPARMVQEGRGWVEDGPGLTTGRFVVEVGTEGPLAAGLGDADRRRPRDWWLRRGGGSVGKVSKPTSFSRCKRRWRAPWLGKRRVGPGGSPRRPLMAGHGQSTGAGARPARDGGGRP
jgi:hypothetical protein